MTEAKPNLITLSDPSYPIESEVEVEDLLATVQAKASLVGPKTPGVHRLLAREDPVSVIGRLRYLYTIEPERFQLTRTWLPAQVWCPGSLPEIAEAVSAVGKEIRDSESWKIMLSKHGDSSISVGKLVDTLSHCVLKSRAELLNPERVVAVAILEDEACVSLLDSDQILEVESEFRLPVPRPDSDRIPVG
jgi:hypothetical protein